MTLGRFHLPVLLVSVLIGSAVSRAQLPRYVDDDAPPGGDGLGWSTAYRFLQDALYEASGDPNVVEIRVATGVYTPDLDEGGHVTVGDITAHFALVSGVRLRGGYAGIGAPAPNARDIDGTPSILSGDLAGDDAKDVDIEYLITEPTRTENSWVVVSAEEVDESAVLEGFTITGGKAYAGGGLFTRRADATIRRCTFVENTARGGLDCEEDGGGAVYCWGGAPMFTRCMFRRNAAVCGGAFAAGHSSRPLLVDCVFEDNRGYRGAGLGVGSEFLDYPHPVLIGCLFRNNRASVEEFEGDAGAIACFMARTSAINTVFIGNVGKWGGAVGVFDTIDPFDFGAVEFTNCTFFANEAQTGRSLIVAAERQATLTNCVLWPGDAATGDAEISWSPLSHNPPAVNYCCIYGLTESGLTGSGNTGADPQFVDPDGPDDVLGTDDDNLRLLPLSPCIDAGDNDALADQTDFAGQPRFVDDLISLDVGQGQRPLVDIGALEYQPPCYGDLNNDGVITMSDLGRLLHRFGMSSGATHEDGDIDLDHDVDISDLSYLLVNFGVSCP